MEKRIFVRADGPEDRGDRKDLVTNGLEAGISCYVLRKGDEEFEGLGKMEAVVYTDGGESTDPDWTFRSVSGPEDQEAVLGLAGKAANVVVDSTDWTVIPLENMIARFRKAGTKVYYTASSRKDADLYLRTMESGADGVVIDVDDPLEIAGFRDMLTATAPVELVEVEVSDVRPLENGDRVCIDTCSLMVPGEGMLVGSYSNCLFLVQSESEDNGYVAARPFRVNAGPVHEYTMVPGGGTRYLSEISSGDPVLLVKRDGSTRVASVGRCKVEIRPLLEIEAVLDGRRYNAIVQNAETVKMVTRDGAVSVSKISKGDRVLAKVSSGGRHFGMQIEETILEK